MAEDVSPDDEIDDVIAPLTRERDEARASESALRERMAVCPKCGSTTHYKYPDPPDAAFMKLYQKYEALRALLREVQWVYDDSGDYVCAWSVTPTHHSECRGKADLDYGTNELRLIEPHAEGCPINAALEGRDE